MPELSDSASRGAGLNGMLSQKLDNLLKEAQIDGKLISSLGTNIKSFHTAAQAYRCFGIISSTTKYNEQVELALSNEIFEWTISISVKDF